MKQASDTLTREWTIVEKSSRLSIILSYYVKVCFEYVEQVRKKKVIYPPP